jgi:hypothetical protein
MRQKKRRNKSGSPLIHSGFWILTPEFCFSLSSVTEFRVEGHAAVNVEGCSRHIARFV